jgi:membrane protein implicated in regulation of membrane protease activity
MKKIQPKPYQKLAWTATAMVIVAALLASFNVYPLYVFMFTAASVLWTYVGWLWREKSLYVLNGILTLIYILGLLFG